ncbi:hypothetical protein EI94DRAFT_1869560, partial [Lactarius quietus]
MTLHLFLRLGRLFLTYYIRPCEQSVPFKGRTPEGSSHSSQESFDKTQDELLVGVNEAPKHYLEAKNQDYSPPVLAVLRQFGYDVDGLNGENVHSLFNVMTTQKDVHDLFDHLELWFERTARILTSPNCYNVRKTTRFFLEPDQVVFTTPDPVKLPLPSPDLLTLHATCAQVAHLSGARDYVDRVLEDMEKLGVLEHDGTSSEVLHHAL